MKREGRKHTKSAGPGHQECATCHPDSVMSRARARLKAKLDAYTPDPDAEDDSIPMLVHLARHIHDLGGDK